MCAPNRKAQPTVNHSPKPKLSCGGPLIHPAPKVAKRTPKIANRVNFCIPKATPISAVKTTYKLVKKAETAGVMSVSPSICRINPPHTMTPSNKPPFHTSRSLSPRHVLGTKTRRSKPAIAKRIMTKKTATSFSSSPGAE